MSAMISRFVMTNQGPAVACVLGEAAQGEGGLHWQVRHAVMYIWVACGTCPLRSTRGDNYGISTAVVKKCLPLLHLERDTN